MRKKTILVVDDSKFDRQLIRNVLEAKSSFYIIEAQEKKECLQILNDQNVDLVLLDIMMPGVHGTELLVEIRNSKNPIELPVIMVTSKAEAEDLGECLKNGANDYVTKPVQFDIALARINAQLKLAELSIEMTRLKEIAALDALISTYHHEINNPLAIALGVLERPDWSSIENHKKLKDALWRVAEVVKRIRAVSEKKQVEYHIVSDSQKMVKVK